ncbi:MAG TPA: hypothetical protein VGG31_06300 [Candidatus Dormibacteraeota bacterium]|jgi:hypothetical protein
MTRKRWLASAAVAAGLLVVAIVAVIAFQSLAGPIAQQAGLASPSTAPCSPAPCVDVEGYTMWITNVRVEGHLVRMQVKFKNSSNSTHSSPDDLSLMDASHSTYKLDTTDPGCGTWTRHEFSGGATFGPLDICFLVNNTTPPFTLRWTPDLGFICCETRLEISPA